MNLQRPIAPDPYELLPSTGSFELTSPGFSDGEDLPEKHSFGAENLSPALAWSGAPAGTKQYVLSCYDPDAPTPSGFWHWFVAGIPAEATSVEEGAGHIGGGSLPRPALQLKNDFGTRDFGGAAPPPGDRAHRYMFAVHALDVADLGLDADTSPAKASFAMLEHVIARATLTGMFAVQD
ncbi:YbhB/YbcL family Raf kinase inhibitor-like protein [Gephyromycinifex aptenodytis]|uniref:YbhB/YbcL family Raf kinase inhibitor-like protein n=1 Tax=Gephyromycinifex aptenodytis TaxID=2716227 RepID=UPI00144897DE|nr:YbhB/YbcL family Raf kinase inhibitor-like protein [Gephyromycinifex aptenodytis]